MKAIYKIITRLNLTMVLFVANQVLADSDYDRAQRLREAGEILPLESILQKLQTRQPGKVLEVELENEHDLLIYEIELLDSNGKVWEVRINAKTGERLQQKKDD